MGANGFSALVDAVKDLPPGLAVLILALLVVMIAFPRIMTALNERHVTRIVAKAIKSEEGALRALGMLRPTTTNPDPTALPEGTSGTGKATTGDTEPSEGTEPSAIPPSPSL